MNFQNKINKLSIILELLSLSTSNILERFGIGKKIIQTNSKKEILAVFTNHKIYYDYFSEIYKIKNNFRIKTLFSSNKLSNTNILKNKLKSKY